VPELGRGPPGREPVPARWKAEPSLQGCLRRQQPTWHPPGPLPPNPDADGAVLTHPRAGSGLSPPPRALPARGTRSRDLSIPSPGVPGGSGRTPGTMGTEDGDQLCRGVTMSHAEIRWQRGTRISPWRLRSESQRRYRR